MSALSRAQLVILLASAVTLLYASTTSASYSTIFVACYAGVSFGLLALYRQQGTLDLFSPVVGLPLILLLYSWGSGVLVDTTGRTPFDDPISDSTRILFYAAAVIGVAGFFGGALLAQRVSALPFRLWAAPSTISPSWYLIAGAVGLGFATVFFGDVAPRFNPLTVQSYSETAFESRVVRMENVTAGVREVLTIYPAVVLLISYATVAALKPGAWFLSRLPAFAILAVFLATTTLSGSRQVVVQTLIVLSIYYHYHRKPLPIAAVALAGVALYVFVNLIAVARRVSDPLAMLRLVGLYLDEFGAGGLGLAASGELVTGANLHRLIEGLEDGQTDYMYGRSIIDELLVFVPRVLYPDRPNSLAEEFVSQFYPGVLEAGGGYGFFILQEGYWMSGLAGVALLMFLFGFGLERLYRWFLRNLHSSYATVLYAWLYSILVMSSVRGGMMSSLKAAMLVAFPLVTLGWCVAKFGSSYNARMKARAAIEAHPGAAERGQELPQDRPLERD